MDSSTPLILLQGLTCFFSHQEAWDSLPTHGLQEAERHQSEEPELPASYPGALSTSAVGSLIHHGGSTRGH